MNTVVLKRGSRLWIKFPSRDDVIDMMRAAETDEEPPEFQIEFTNPDVDELKRVSRLWFFLLFDAGGAPPQWLVEFSHPRAKCSHFLAATSSPSKEAFVQRTRCGVVETFREACLLKADATVSSAITWFLDEGTRDPTLTWIDSGQVVRQAT